MKTDEAIELAKAVLLAIGAGFAVLGVLKMCAGYAEHNPEKRLQGMSGIIAGAALLQTSRDFTAVMACFPATEGSV